MPWLSILSLFQPITFWGGFFTVVSFALTFVFIISSAYSIWRVFGSFIICLDFRSTGKERCEFLAQCKSLQNANTLADRWTLKSLGQGQAWLDRHWVKRSESSACLKANTSVTIMCRNDELSTMMSWVGCLLKYSELFILFAKKAKSFSKFLLLPFS